MCGQKHTARQPAHSTSTLHTTTPHSLSSAVPNMDTSLPAHLAASLLTMDTSLDALEAALAPFLSQPLSSAAIARLPPLDKARLNASLAYCSGSLMFCACAGGQRRAENEMGQAWTVCSENAQWWQSEERKKVRAAPARSA